MYELTEMSASRFRSRRMTLNNAKGGDKFNRSLVEVVREKNLDLEIFVKLNESHFDV